MTATTEALAVSDLAEDATAAMNATADDVSSVSEDSLDQAEGSMVHMSLEFLTLFLL
jgi:hypothetical protein